MRSVPGIVHHAILAVLLAAGSTGPPPGSGDPPVAVFADLDGRWAGVFVGYDDAGRELYRIRVRQEYETVDATTQRVTITDTMPDGTVIRGAGENTARRLPDGTLRLQCVVRKSNGDTVRHDGRVVQGPDGDHQIMWHSRDGDRVETFRESVRSEGARTVYEINGMGRYGTTSILMTGRYVRQPEPKPEPSS
jgi:hypothetical protein